MAAVLYRRVILALPRTHDGSGQVDYVGRGPLLLAEVREIRQINIAAQLGR